jgi:hypothetical protein
MKMKSKLQEIKGNAVTTKQHVFITEIPYEDFEWLIEQVEKIEQYKKEIVELRGKAHLSCPVCYEDCIGWVADGEPCRKDW